MDGEVPEEKSQRYEISINGHVEQPSGTGVDREMRELQEAIRLIQHNSHQALRLFTVKNAIEKQVTDHYLFYMIFAITYILYLHILLQCKLWSYCT